MVLANVKGWFHLAGIEITDDQDDDIVQQAEPALQAYISLVGNVEFLMPAHFISLVK